MEATLQADRPEDRIETDLSDLISNFLTQLPDRLALNDIQSINLDRPAEALELIRKVQLEVERSRKVAAALKTAAQQSTRTPRRAVYSSVY